MIVKGYFMADQNTIAKLSEIGVGVHAVSVGCGINYRFLGYDTIEIPEEHEGKFEYRRGNASTPGRLETAETN